jgi:hypothetical protein
VEYPFIAGVFNMAANAPQIQYRQEFIAAFEQHQSLLRESVTTEATIKGNQAVFLVAGSGSATAVTRGINGLIPARADSLTQTTATLAEWHDLCRKTGFNIFESQSDQRAIMQMTTMAVINRKIDQDILTTAATGTVNTGTAVTASVALVGKTKTILGNAGVPWDNNIFAVISPAFEAYLMQAKEFANREYIGGQPFDGTNPAWRDRPMMYSWWGVNWMVHPNLSGAGTNAEKCFMWHKSALGQAIDTKGLDVDIGYDGEQQYSWARTSVFEGCALLQNTGVVIMNHDGSAYVAG